MESNIGKYACSTAGRDKGKYFVITGVADDQHVFLVDGHIRRLEKPKKKKLKHVYITEHVAETLMEKMHSRRKMLDSDIRESIKQYVHERAISETAAQGSTIENQMK